jgi:hypothetical protein
LYISNLPTIKLGFNSRFQVHHVDADNLLIAEHGIEESVSAQERIYATYLYLVRIKYSKWNGQASYWKGAVLDTTRLEEFYLEEQILFHPEDRHKFTIFESDEFFTAVKGRIEDGKIVLTNKVKFDLRDVVKISESQNFRSQNFRITKFPIFRRQWFVFKFESWVQYCQTERI